MSICQSCLYFKPQSCQGGKIRAGCEDKGVKDWHAPCPEFKRINSDPDPDDKCLEDLINERDHLRKENARLRAALERCRDKFKECARIHRGKIDSSKAILSQEDKENLGKYDRSKAMAQICEEALKR